MCDDVFRNVVNVCDFYRCVINLMNNFHTIKEKSNKLFDIIRNCKNNDFYNKENLEKLETDLNNTEKHLSELLQDLNNMIFSSLSDNDLIDLNQIINKFEETIRDLETSLKTKYRFKDLENVIVIKIKTVLWDIIKYLNKKAMFYFSRNDKEKHKKYYKKHLEFFDIFSNFELDNNLTEKISKIDKKEFKMKYDAYLLVLRVSRDKNFVKNIENKVNETVKNCVEIRVG